MAVVAINRSGGSTPVQVFFMTCDTTSMKGFQKRHRDVFACLPFVTTGALAPFPLVSIRKHPEIMMADQTLKEVFMLVVIKPYQRLLVWNKFLALNDHDAFGLRPCLKRKKEKGSTQRRSEIKVFHFGPHKWVLDG